MKVDLIMLSKLGTGDGGRETWLQNFLGQIEKEKLNCQFNLFTLKKEPDNITTGLLDKNKLILQEVEINCIKGYVPIPVKFIIKFFINSLFKTTTSDFVVAVGGLHEALAVAVSYLGKSHRYKKILWLRTIYTKEKGYRLNKFTQKFILKIEIFIIKRFFHLVIANGEDTASFYREKGIECTVIKNAIDLARWTEIKPVASSKIRIAFVGRLSEVKGIVSFLRSIELLKKHPHHELFEFLVVGSGPFSKDVKLMADQGLLTYCGALPNSEIPNFLAQVDCCVALTFAKDFMGGGGVSNALIEQMAAGKILIAWRNKIFLNVLAEDNAYLICQDSVDDLVDCYLEIEKNKLQAHEKAIAAKKLSEQYAIKSHVEQFFSLINFYRN